jgi:transposase
MDLGEPYGLSTMTHVPEAAQKIVHDPYHLGRRLSEAVDQVRKAEPRCLEPVGDQRWAGTQ